MLESGDGALHRNFELIAPGPGHSWVHWWRDNSVSALPWAKAETIGNDVADPPTFTATTYNRNFEMVYRTTANRLHHRYFDQAAQKWDDGPIFGSSSGNSMPLTSTFRCTWRACLELHRTSVVPREFIRHDCLNPGETADANRWHFGATPKARRWKQEGVNLAIAARLLECHLCPAVTI